MIFLCQERHRFSALTLLLVHSDDDHALVATDADEFVDGADSPTRQLAEEDHALDVVVLQQADVGAHLGDGPDVHHDDVIHLWEPVLVEATVESRHCWEREEGRDASERDVTNPRHTIRTQFQVQCFWFKRLILLEKWQ